MSNREGLSLEAFIELKELKCTHVMCKFSGSGDNGSIDEVLGYNIWKPTEDHIQDIIEDGSISGLYKGIDLPSHLMGDIEQLFYHTILNEIEDWYNNEGGAGTLLLDVATGKVYTKCAYNIEEDWNEETEEYDYTDTYDQFYEHILEKADL